MKTAGWMLASGLAWLLNGQPVLADDLARGVAEYRRGNYALAHDILHPLAADGNPYAQFSLGAMHDDGRGVPQDYGLALKWYRKAAEQGLADAQYLAGMHYATGRGMKVNIQRAYVWLNLAAAGGHPDGERARDQEESEMSRAEAVEAQGIASAWQRKYPWHLSCRMRSCIHPQWRPRPAYGPFETLN